MKSRDPKRLAEWYSRHLGIPVKEGSAVFAWRGLANPKREGHTVWALFPADSDYFGAKRQLAMVNYRVKNLRRTLAQLRKEKVKVVKKIEEFEYGKFAWIVDPDGNRIELWEPPRNYRSIEKQFPSE